MGTAVRKGEGTGGAGPGVMGVEDITSDSVEGACQVFHLLSHGLKFATYREMETNDA